MFEVNEYHLEILREASKYKLGIYEYELINAIAKQRGDYNATSDRIKALIEKNHLRKSNNRITLTPEGLSRLETLENRVRLNKDEEEDRAETRRIARRANTLSIIALVIAAITAVATIVALVS